VRINTKRNFPIVKFLLCLFQTGRRLMTVKGTLGWGIGRSNACKLLPARTRRYKRGNKRVAGTYSIIW